MKIEFKRDRILYYDIFTGKPGYITYKTMDLEGLTVQSVIDLLQKNEDIYYSRY